MIFALILAAQAVEGQGVAVADPFAPARAGLIECTRPDPEHHTCRALTRYETTPDGAYISTSLMQIRSDPSMSIEVVGAGKVSDAIVYTVYFKAAWQKARVFDHGRLLSNGVARPVIARVVKELRPLFGHFDETSYWNTGNGLVEIDRLDGDPELASTQTVIWVKPEDGYTVNGVQLDLSR